LFGWLDLKRRGDEIRLSNYDRLINDVAIYIIFFDFGGKDDL